MRIKMQVTITVPSGTDPELAREMFSKTLDTGRFFFDYRTCPLTDRRLAELKHGTGFSAPVTVVEPRPIPAELIPRIEDDIRVLRQVMNENIRLKYSDEITLVLVPRGWDDRVTVEAKGRGSVTASFLEDGLAVDAYSEDSQLREFPDEPVESFWLTNDEMGKAEEEDDA